MLEIAALSPTDRASWERLARGYKAFYKTEASPEQYEATWQRLMRGDRIFGIGAHLDGQLVGITHYLFHPHAWQDDVCYLQDVFVDETVRGRGVARALIERVAQAAREQGAQTLYWLTQDENTRARLLYDKVALYRGFIRYDYQPSH